MPLIAGFAEAARLGRLELDETAALVSDLKEYMIMRLSEEVPETIIIGDGGSPFLLSLSVPGYKSEVMMSFLDGEGICVSTGAACKKGSRSRVLEAMRLRNDVIDGALRVSFSRDNTQDEAERFVQSLKRAAASILKPL